MGACVDCPCSVDVVPGCRESAEKRGNCSEPPATRRKARATSWRTAAGRLAVNFCTDFFCHRRRRLDTLAVSAPTSPSRHGIAVAGWGPRYFPLLLNLFLDVIFPGSLRSRGCVGAKPTWSLVNRPQATASDRRAPRTPQSHPPSRLSLDSPDKRQRRASVPGQHVGSTSRRRSCDLLMEPATDPDSRWPRGALDDARPQRILPVGCPWL